MRARRCASTRRSAATRTCSPISSGGCSRTAPTRASSTASPTRRCRSTSWCATRSPSSPRSAQAQPDDRRCRAELFGAERRNSAGVDLSDPLVREPLLERLKALESRELDRRADAREGQARADRRSPHDRRIDGRDGVRGQRRRGRPRWSAPATPRRSAGTRSAARPAPRLLERAADLYEEHAEEFISLCIREAGKTLPDAVLEVREAVDFLRYYASEARRQFAGPLPLPGPTGEQNELRLHGRGVFASIQPMEFPAGDLHRPDRRRRSPRAMR